MLQHDVPTKEITARLCELCELLYGEEWETKYTEPQERLRDWLNQKTGLSVDQTKDNTKKAGALMAWVAALEELAAK